MQNCDSSMEHCDATLKQCSSEPVTTLRTTGSTVENKIISKQGDARDTL